MFSICSTEDIGKFSGDREIISVFLATDFDDQEIGWVFRNWRALDKETNARWHLLVPTKEPIRDNLDLAKSWNFDFSLSEDLINSYGIRKEDTPCIVFDNKNDEDRQFFISISQTENKKVRNNLFKVSRIINNNLKFKYLNSYEWQKNTIGDIQNTLVSDKLFKNMPNIALKSFSLLRNFRPF